jgi:hypothetical protein
MREESRCRGEQAGKERVAPCSANDAGRHDDVVLPDEALSPALNHRHIVHLFRGIVHWQSRPAKYDPAQT